MKRWAWAWTIGVVLLGSAPAAAEFTEQEKASIRRLVEAGESVRAAAKTAPLSALPALSEANSHLMRATFYLVGAVVGRNPAERQALCQSEIPLDFANCVGPRSEYVTRAWAELDASGQAVNVDRTLAYADIWPQDHLTQPRLSIGVHGPYQPAQTHLWRSAGQYQDDGKKDLEAALLSGEACECPDRDAMARQALAQMHLIQNAQMRGAARAARVGMTLEEELQEAQNPRDFALRPIVDVSRSAQQHYMNATALLAKLAEMPLGPIWRERVRSATVHTADSWRHAGFWADVFMDIPEELR